MKDTQPQPIYLKDYRVPDFLIEETRLTFDLYEDFTGQDMCKDCQVVISHQDN